MCAMSKLNIVLLLYYVHLYSRQSCNLELLDRSFFKSGQNANFWSKVGKTGVGETGVQEYLY